MSADVIEMSVQDWIAVKDNPRQRDTAKRAKIASRKHLQEYCKIHRFVYAASRNGSILCKLDGHTRAMLWQDGELDTPPDGKVSVCLIDVADMAEAKEVYDQLDSRISVKKPADDLFGACREARVTLNSSLLNSCTFSTQLKLAETGRKFSGDIHSLVRDWKTELIALDSLGMTRTYTILIGVMLVAIRRDGIEKAGEFFVALDKAEGTKTSAGYDGVQLLHEMYKVRKAEGRTAGWDNLVQICGQAWTAYELFKRGKRKMRSSLSIADFNAIITSREKVGA